MRNIMYAHNLHVDVQVDFDTRRYCETIVLSVVAEMGCRLQETVFGLLDN